jgi:hypothetical protein
MDFRVEEGEPKVRVKISDGSVIEIELKIMSIFRSGNDPNTGLPVYPLQSNISVRLVSCPKNLRKAPLRTSAAGPATAATDAR